MNQASLSDQNILVTGAAGRIGSATARHALAAGATVILTDIASQPLQALAESLQSDYGSNVCCHVADITTEAGIDSLISNALEKHGRIDGAVHSAYPRSKAWGTRFEQLSADSLHKDLSMQLGSAILLSQRLMRCFQDTGHGSLIHLSSIQGVQAPKFEHYEGTDMSSPIEYAAIKAGIISITRWLAKYYANQNIRVNCVSPGGVIDNQPKDFLQRYRKSCTNIGMLSAEQIAAVILFLLTPDAAAINGQNIIVDDGWTL